MKKLILFFIFSLCILSGSAAWPLPSTFYYPTHSFGFNGDIGVYNGSGREFLITDRYIIYGAQQQANFVKELDSGDRLYRNSGSYGIVVDFVVSKDKKHLAQVGHMFNQWTMTTWFTISKEEQLAFYAANKQYERDGITFDFSWDDSSSNSTSSRSSGHSSCSSCGGTGVSRTANSGGSLSSWVKYYNSRGNRCPYCNSTSQHFHDQCPKCMGRGTK